MGHQVWTAPLSDHRPQTRTAQRCCQQLQTLLLHRVIADDPNLSQGWEGKGRGWDPLHSLPHSHPRPWPSHSNSHWLLASPGCRSWYCPSACCCVAPEPPAPHDSSSPAAPAAGCGGCSPPPPSLSHVPLSQGDPSHPPPSLPLLAAV